MAVWPEKETILAILTKGAWRAIFTSVACSFSSRRISYFFDQVFYVHFIFQLTDKNVPRLEQDNRFLIS